MNATVLCRAVFVGIVTTPLLVVGTTGAWAGPAPVGGEPARDVSPAGGSAVGGTPAWELVTIGAASAALAVLLTLLVLYVGRHRRSPRHPAPA
jgi:hypothetical protein